MTLTWERALADCEARLDAAEVALSRGTALPVSPFSEAEIEGPLPAALAERARECCARGAELEQRLSHELERIRLELRRLPRMPRAQSEARFQAQA